MIRLVDGAFERPRNGQKNDQAHPPIHPTACVNNLEGVEKRVYELVVRRFLACCSSNARGLETTVTVEIAGEGFTAHGMSISSKARNVSIYFSTLALQAWSYWKGTTSMFTYTINGMATFYRNLRSEKPLCPQSARSKKGRQLDQICSLKPILSASWTRMGLVCTLFKTVLSEEMLIV